MTSAKVSVRPPVRLAGRPPVRLAGNLFIMFSRCTDRSRPLYDVVRGLTTQYVAASEIGSCFIEVAFSPFFVLNLCGIALETSRFDEGSTCTNMSIKNNEG